MVVIFVCWKEEEKQKDERENKDNIMMKMMMGYRNH